MLSEISNELETIGTCASYVMQGENYQFDNVILSPTVWGEDGSVTFLVSLQSSEGSWETINRFTFHNYPGFLTLQGIALAHSEAAEYQ